MITYFKNQSDLSKALKEAVDEYWALKNEERDFIAFIIQVSENNKDILFNADGDYSTAIKQKIGIKRLRLISKVLEKK